MITSGKIFKSLTFLLIFGTSSAYSQKTWETKERVYVGGVVMAGLVDVVDAKITSLKPYGKNVEIKYDPYFDRYVIKWDDVDGSTKLNLTFKQSNSATNMYKDDASNTEYFVTNSIEKENLFTVMAADATVANNRQVKLILVFSDLK